MAKIDDPQLTELRAEREAWAAEIRAVIDTLNATRHTFKSKQIQHAKLRLLALLVPMGDEPAG